MYQSMKSMKKNLIIAAAFMFATSTWAADSSGKWSLKDCIDYAMANNITLKKSGLTKQSSGEDLKQAQAALFPSLSVSTSHSVGYRPWINQGTATVSNGTVATGVDKTYYSGSYGVNANWTVLFVTTVNYPSDQPSNTCTLLHIGNEYLLKNISTLHMHL